MAADTASQIVTHFGGNAAAEPSPEALTPLAALDAAGVVAAEGAATTAGAAVFGEGRPDLLGMSFLPGVLGDGDGAAFTAVEREDARPRRATGILKSVAN
jgi:hypothetical protein